MYIEMFDLYFDVDAVVITTIALMITLVKIAKYYSEVCKHEIEKVGKKYRQK